MPNQWDLSKFQGTNYDKGRGPLVQIAWIFFSGAITMRWWCPNKLRIAVLRSFGAKIGNNVLVRHRVRIHWPWKLTIGDNSWVGEGAWLLNLEPISLGRNVCISQDVLLCTGSHDRMSSSFEFDNGPIAIDDNSWVAARAIVLRGVTVGERTTIGAGALVVRDVDPGSTILSSPAAIYGEAGGAKSKH